jgi:hypothetical protein
MQWQPMTDVAATTTPERAAAIRARLMRPPKLRLVPQARVEVPLPPVSRADMIAHDKRIMGFVEEMTFDPSLPKFVEIMARNYRFSVREIKGPYKEAELTLVRQKIAWLTKRKFPKHHMAVLARSLGRDRSTIIHSINKIEALIASNDPSVADLKGWLND